jgi:hypothetical protein
VNIPGTTLALPLLAVLAVGAVAHHPDHEQKTQRQIEAVRKATERFRDVREARRAGYVPAGECVAGPGGAMGVHYTNARLAGDPRLSIRQPEILVYEPHGDKRRLVAVEYYRPDADGRLDTDDDRPRLFGRGFDGPMEGHEPGMPVHYDLHAWVWKHNPAGTFSQFNPRVSCP